MNRSRAGFTLIELTIVVVIIAILAAVGIPKFMYTKSKGYSAAARSDLRNLVTAEESYFSVHGVYSADLNLLGARSSNGVVIAFGTTDGSGWSAKAVHPAANPLVCAIYFGSDAHQLAPATEEGHMVCTTP